MKLRCVTIDDEPLALELINSFVRNHADLELVASYGSANRAVEELEQLGTLHLVFLDIQMPKHSGMEVASMLQELPEDSRPMVVFTTAYNQYAAESYRVNAIDYLLKPFDEEDFFKAVEKAINHLRARNLIGRTTDHFFVRVDYRLVKIRYEQVRYVQGFRDSVKIFLKDIEEPIITIATLTSLEQKLPKAQFLRIQRSFIVSVSAIDAITKYSVWIGNTEIPVGSVHKEVLRMLTERLGG